MQATFGPDITLPTKHGDFNVRHVVVHGDTEAFREGVVLDRPTSKRQPLVRVQSSCLFSESFWATDCDCALQLQESLTRISVVGGALVYFYEEGRGAGLEAKFKAIQLQQRRGMDTRQAYECLNLNIDNRSYDAAAAVLRKLYGSRSIVLLTNNESKVQGLRNHGIDISAVESLVCGADQPRVRRYLEEKAAVFGHRIDLDQSDAT